MKPHQSILILFLLSAIIIGISFFYIYKSSLNNPPEASGMKNPGRKRFYFFAVWSAVLGVLLSVTIPKSPYYLFSEEIPSEVIYAAARQYSYTMSHQAIDPQSPPPREDIEIPVNEVVEFRVTSLDVNHGFAIYNEDSELITQTQAMPGYVNRLRWKFTDPGIYNVFCLEFCGMGHALMKSSFTVK